MTHGLVPLKNNLVHLQQLVCARRWCHGKNRVKMKSVLTFYYVFLLKNK